MSSVSGTDTGSGSETFTRKFVTADTGTQTETFTRTTAVPDTGAGVDLYTIAYQVPDTGTVTDDNVRLINSIQPVGDFENKWTAEISNTTTTGQRFDGTSDAQRWLSAVLNDGD